MPKYLVTVNITTSREEEYEITARNLDDAWQKAREEYEHNDSGRSAENEVAEVTDVEED